MSKKSNTNSDDNNAISAADKLARKDESPAKNVAKWMEEVHHGVLATISNEDGIPGFPFGSIVPFGLDDSGKPFILVAEMAAHTKNMLHSDKVCLFLSQQLSTGDPQSNWRVSIIGNMKRIVPQRRIEELDDEMLEDCIQVTDDDESHLLARYIERVPQAERYLRTHNFYFWKMHNIEKIRYIAGFGKICWISAEELHSAMNDVELDEIKQGSIEHMNEDHEDAMIILCEGTHGFKPESANMIDLDCGGVLMHTMNPEKLVYSPFGKRILADDLRMEIVNLIKKARISINAN